MKIFCHVSESLYWQSDLHCTCFSMSSNIKLLIFQLFIVVLMHAVWMSGSLAWFNTHTNLVHSTLLYSTYSTQLNSTVVYSTKPHPTLPYSTHELFILRNDSEDHINPLISEMSKDNAFLCFAHNATQLHFKTKNNVIFNIILVELIDLKCFISPLLNDFVLCQKGKLIICYMWNETKNNKHNVELQRADPGTKVTG